MEIAGLLIGFAVLIVLCFFDVNVYLVVIISSIIVCITNGLPLQDTLVNTALYGAGTYLGQYIGLYIFGSILGKLYTYSGGAAIISKTLLKWFIRDSFSERTKHRIGFVVVILTGAILCYGGINCVILVFTLYPISLVIFEELDIPRKYITGTILGGTITFAMTGPGSPQPPNVVAMNILGTPSTAGLIPGIVAIFVELIVMVFTIEALCHKSKLKGEHFTYGEKDTPYDANQATPSFLAALAPLIVIFVLFNLVGLDLVFALLFGTLVCGLLFFKFVGNGKFSAMLQLFNDGAHMAPASMFSVASVVGFGMVVQSTQAFKDITNALLNLPLPPVILLIIAVGALSLLTGGAAAGQQLALPVIAPSIIEMGLPAEFIHRISCFTGSTLDTNPSSGTVIMCVNASGLSLREAYPAIFCSTVVGTSCGTATVAILLTLFPGLA